MFKHHYLTGVLVLLSLAAGSAVASAAETETKTIPDSSIHAVAYRHPASPFYRDRGLYDYAGPPVPIDILNAEPIRERAAQAVSTSELIKPCMQRLIDVAAIVACLHRHKSTEKKDQRSEKCFHCERLHGDPWHAHQDAAAIIGTSATCAGSAQTKASYARSS